MEASGAIWGLMQMGAFAFLLLGLVFSTPIAFDEGGRDAGLAYLLALFLYYLVLTVPQMLEQLQSFAGRLPRSSASRGRSSSRRCWPGR
jgi:hypothetical protein